MGGLTRASATPVPCLFRAFLDRLWLLDCRELDLERDFVAEGFDLLLDFVFDLLLDFEEEACRPLLFGESYLRDFFVLAFRSAFLCGLKSW